VAEQLGVVGDSVTYAMGAGVALVTTRKLGVVDSDTDLYYVKSEGTVTNIFTPSSPARRAVGAYAYHHRRPLPTLSALVTTAARAGVGTDGINGIVSGNDHNSSSDCSAASGASDIAGVIARIALETNGGGLEGSPDGLTGSPYNSFTNIYNAVGLRWDVLTHSSFPVDFENVEPNWATIPSDSFPVIRITGSFSGDSWDPGRGVLIVTGELNSGDDFYWDGIVLAGALEDDQEGHIDGMVVGGLNAQNPDNTVVFDEGGWVRYYSCTAWDANESLSYLELLSDTEWEID
jgi:hypothetical protein